jgi:hypothetical protein
VIGDMVLALQLVSTLTLVGVVWLSTFLVQVPAHERLALAYEPATQRRLVTSNWIRTASWTARGLVLGWVLVWT